MLLIPKPHFQLIDRSKINKKHFLGVWVEKSIRLKDGDGKLNPAAIQIKRIPGFSTNKFPPSKKWYLNINFLKEFSSLYRTIWKKGEAGVYPPKDHYEFNKERDYYFLRISDVDGFRGEYKNPPHKEDIFQFELQVVHKPLISNYWHFEFQVDSAHGIIPEANAGWKKLVCSAILDRVQDKAIFKI